MKRLIIPLLVALSACTGEQLSGTGAVEFSVNGGAGVREGFPHQEGDVTHAFVDGWSLAFTHYVVSLGGVTLTPPDAVSVGGQWTGPAVVDLATTASAAVVLTTLKDVSAVRHAVSFDFVPVSSSTSAANVEAPLFEEMAQHGWSLLAEGTATHTDGRAVRFHLGLPVATHYSECINGKDKTDGLAVEADKTTGVFIYSHAIHLFWDTLATGDEDLRFEAFAAMRGDDDLVTSEEIGAQDLNSPVGEGGKPLRDASGRLVFYNDNGVLKPGEQTLYHFTLEGGRASAHFNGVGLCRQERLQ